MSCLETRHGAFSSTFRRRILRGGYIAWRTLRSRTLEGPAGWSFDPSAERAMTTARPPLSLIICPCLPLLSTDYCLSPCCHTLRRCSLTVRALCLCREEWDHDSPAVTTRNSCWHRRRRRCRMERMGVAEKKVDEGASALPPLGSRTPCGRGESPCLPPMRRGIPADLVRKTSPD